MKADGGIICESQQNAHHASTERNGLVQSDLLIAEHPWHCSDLILYTSAFGAREGGKDRVAIPLCV